MANLFYNPQERRLRALVRIIIQIGLFLLANIVFGIILSFIMMAILTLQGKLSLEIMSDAAALNDLIMNGLGGFYVMFSQIFSLGSILLTFLFAAKFLDRRKFKDFGFRFSKQWFADFGFGLLLGGVLMTLIFLTELAFGWVEIAGYLQTASTQAPAIILVLFSFIGYICVGIYEEMLFRGYHLRNLAEGLNFKFLGNRGAILVAYILSSSIFGIAHMANPNATVVSTVNIILAGLFLGLGFVLTGELAIPMGLHITWNFFQGNVFGFPVSGTGHGSSFIEINQLGSTWMTGGNFGPEAGVMGILAMLLGTLLTILYVKQTRGKVKLETKLAEYQTSEQVVSSGKDQTIEEVPA